MHASTELSPVRTGSKPVATVNLEADEASAAQERQALMLLSLWAANFAFFLYYFMASGWADLRVGLH